MTKRILAIASGGGHWRQLQLLCPAFEGQDVSYLTTLHGLAEADGMLPAVVVPDCNRNRPVAAVKSAFLIAAHVLRKRPDVVLTTGALPGLIGIVFGRMVGARTVWVESLANAERLSMSGAMAMRVAHLCLSQWPHVAEETGAEYAGSIL